MMVLQFYLKDTLINQMSLSELNTQVIIALKV